MTRDEWEQYVLDYHSLHDGFFTQFWATSNPCISNALTRLRDRGVIYYRSREYPMLHAVVKEIEEQ